MLQGKALKHKTEKDTWGYIINGKLHKATLPMLLDPEATMEGMETIEPKAFKEMGDYDLIDIEITIKEV